MVQFLVIIGLSILVGFFFSRQLEARKLGYLQEKIIPYTLTVREIRHDDSKGTILMNESVEARRSDGATVMRKFPLYKEGIGIERHISFPSGLIVVINEKASIKTSTQYKEVSLASAVRDPASKCLNSFVNKPFQEGETIEGEEMVSGYKTVRINNGRGVLRWLALEHGCARIKDQIVWGPGEGKNETVLVSLVDGEPDSNLFEISGGLREVSPSERMQILLRESCPSCLDNQQNRIKKADEDYFRHRPK